MESINEDQGLFVVPTGQVHLNHWGLWWISMEYVVAEEVGEISAPVLHYQPILTLLG
jgi:hypothetical protein